MFLLIGTTIIQTEFMSGITEYFPFNPIFSTHKKQQILFQLSGIFNEKKTLKINNNNNIVTHLLTTNEWECHDFTPERKTFDFSLSL